MDTSNSKVARESEDMGRDEKIDRESEEEEARDNRVLPRPTFRVTTGRENYSVYYCISSLLVLFFVHVGR